MIDSGLACGVVFSCCLGWGVIRCQCILAVRGWAGNSGLDCDVIRYCIHINCGLDCGFIRNLIPVNSELDYGVISV